MTPDVVVDIGNSRVKWAQCDLRGGPPDSYISLPHENPTTWTQQLGNWKLPRVRAWAVASVHPGRLARFRAWAEGRGEPVTVIDSYRQVALEIRVPAPEQVGIDRLLNALAFRSQLPAGTPGIVIGAGTAVTVDLIEGGAFAGGAILPGPRLMFESMHRHTAKLPLINTHIVPTATVPGTNTRDAMTLGVMAAQLGAAEFLVREYAKRGATPPQVVLTGGAIGALKAHHFEGVAGVTTDPLLTLRGIQLAAGALP